MVRTQALFTNFCIVWLNVPPPPYQVRVVIEFTQTYNRHISNDYIYDHSLSHIFFHGVGLGVPLVEVGRGLARPDGVGDGIH